MAEDPQDRSRWLAGLQYYRKEIEVRSNPSLSSATRLKSFVEPVNRMSAAFLTRND
jgi:hypothetical protein